MKIPCSSGVAVDDFIGNDASIVARAGHCL